jgi:PAS domain S-box-containing protein
MAEMELQAHIEGWLQLCISASNIGLWDWDLATNRVNFSREWKNQIGYAEDEISNSFEEWQSRVHPDDLEATLHKVRTSIDSPHGRHYVEFRFRHKNGTYRWISAQGAVVRDAEGKPIRMLGCHIDLTERKQAKEKLRESEERFRIMADGCPAIIWVTGAEGGNRSVNRAYREFFGVTQEQVEGGKWQPLVHPDDAPVYMEAMVRAIGQRAPFRAEARVRRADGEWRWIASYAEPLQSASGEYLGHVGISSDITERRQVEDALRRSESEQRRQREFLVNLLAHAPYGISVHKGHDFVYELVNQAYHSMVGSEVREHLFEPFISQSPGRERLGLGLFLGASLLNMYDGRLLYEERSGGGASFVIEVPPARFTRGQPYHWFVGGSQA